MFDLDRVNSQEFIRRLRTHARKTGRPFHYDARHGKGSHGRISYDGRFTTIKRGEFGPGLFAKMLRDLGIDKAEF